MKKYVIINCLLQLVAAFAEIVTGGLLILVLMLNHFDGIDYWSMWLNALAAGFAMMTIVFGSARLIDLMRTIEEHFEED